MPTPPKSSTKQGADSPRTALDIASALAPWSMGSRMASAWVEGTTRMNSEWAQFIANRLTKDAKTQHEIFTCKSPVEAQRLATIFMRTAMTDYFAEAARISTMGLKVAHDASIENAGAES